MSAGHGAAAICPRTGSTGSRRGRCSIAVDRSEEHTSELQSQSNLVCRLLLAKNNSSCRHLSLTDNGVEFSVRDCFHDVRRPHRIMQTFHFYSELDEVTLRTAWFDDLRNVRTH